MNLPMPHPGARRRLLQPTATGMQSGVCPVCGKSATRQRRFVIDVDRRVLDEDQKTLARAVVREVADDWAREQVFHAKCEEGELWHLYADRGLADREKFRALMLKQWEHPTARTRHDL